MKLFTAVLLALAFGPSLLDRVLSGRNAPAPTPTFPTRTFTDACTTRKVTMQVPPTSRVVTHNKPGKSLPFPSFYGTASSIVWSLALSRPSPLTALFPCVFSGKIFFVHSTISISTNSRVTSSFTGTGHVAFAPKPVHQLQTFWNGVRHWLRCESGRFVEEIVMIFLDLCPFLIIGLALLWNRALQRRRLTSELLERTRVPLAWIEVPSVEGLLLLYSYTTTSAESPDQWRGLWIPRRMHTYYLSNGPINCDVVLVQPNASDSALLGNLLRSLWSYHPWAPHLAKIHLSARNNIMASEPTVQVPCRELGLMCRPHLRRAIEKFGSSPTQVVSKVVIPEQARVHRPVEWIDVPPSVEGALKLYAYFASSPDSPREWTSQYFPRHPHTYYLSDRPANLDSLLLGILLRSISIYHPWAPQLAGFVLDIPGKIVEEAYVIEATNSAVKLEVATIPQTGSRPTTPAPTSTTGTPTTALDCAESGPIIGLESPVVLAALEDVDNADGFDNNWVQGSSTLPPSLDSSSVCDEEDTMPQSSGPNFAGHGAFTSQVRPFAPTAVPGSSFASFGGNAAPAYQHPPTAYHPYTTPFSYQHTPTAYHPYPTSIAYHSPTAYQPSSASFAYQHTPTAYHPYSSPVAYPPRPMNYHPYTTHVAYQRVPEVYHHHPTHMMTPQPLPAEQAAAAHQEMRPLFPVLEERASQPLVGGSMGFREAMAEEAGPEEREEKKKFRRGGRRLTARKRRYQELEKRGEDEGNPEAGPSSARLN